MNYSPSRLEHGREGLADRASAKRGSKVQAESGGSRTKYPMEKEDARAQGHDKGSRVEWGGCSSLRVRVQLTEGAGVVDVEDEISWCRDFNRRVCRGDGL